MGLIASIIIVYKKQSFLSLLLKINISFGSFYSWYLCGIVSARKSKIMSGKSIHFNFNLFTSSWYNFLRILLQSLSSSESSFSLPVLPNFPSIFKFLQILHTLSVSQHPSSLAQLLQIPTQSLSAYESFLSLPVLPKPPSLSQFFQILP